MPTELALDALEMAIWTAPAAGHDWKGWCIITTPAVKPDSTGRRNTGL